MHQNVVYSTSIASLLCFEEVTGCFLNQFSSPASLDYLVGNFSTHITAAKCMTSTDHPLPFVSTPCGDIPELRRDIAFG